MPQIPLFNQGAELTQTEVYDYILKHLDRAKNNTEVNPENEVIGIGINGDDITKLINAGAKDFIAFHAVEGDSHTMILVGVTENRQLVKPSNTLLAIERWDKFGPSLEDVDKDVNNLYNVFS